ncbi:MAG: LapA family protein [Symploca sp. SIO3C6]|nr:LapA family protein [Symploca sp. SIO3C6]NET06653.1 LapA family protein [Symploca sp. SIO2B6]
MRPLVLILAIVVVAATVILAVQNLATVSVYFVVWQIEASLAAFLLLTLAAGFLASFLLSMPTVIQKNWKIANHKQRIVQLEKESNEMIETISAQRKRIEYLEKSFQQEIESTKSIEPKQKQ